MGRFENFRQVKILVVGDVMLDKYLWGDVKRISPEAPVPVVNLKQTSYIAGGAANVAANIAGLGARPFLVGVVGDDAEGCMLPEVLAGTNVSTDHLVKLSNRQTTVKTRVIAHNQQILRIDRETTLELSEDDLEIVWQKIESLLSVISIIVVSDYNKGFLSGKLLSRLITQAKAKGISVLIDPKGRDYNKYRGATVITPNKFEAADICRLDGFGEKEILQAGNELISKLEVSALLITRGEEGMTLFEEGKMPVHLEAQARHVYDVTGAGDTVIASLAVALGAGESFAEAAELANTAAGLVVSEVGTTAVNIETLKNTFKVLD
jgi:rfaE bifunctional protein kinase chain/domain